jgi:anti-sigma-K factor RskA
MADQPDRDDDAMLTAYVRGRLPEAEAARIAGEAAARPELAADIALMRGIVSAFDDEAREAAPGELGWARLSRALDAEPSRAAAPARTRRSLWPLAASAAAAVLIWQVAAVPLLTRPGGEPGYAPVSEAPAAGFALDVAFAPAANEAAIRALLQDVDARVSDGPSAIGLWTLSFRDAGARDAALAALEAAPIVESVQAR